MPTIVISLGFHLSLLFSSLWLAIFLQLDLRSSTIPSQTSAEGRQELPEERPSWEFSVYCSSLPWIISKLITLFWPKRPSITKLTELMKRQRFQAYVFRLTSLPIKYCWCAVLRFWSPDRVGLPHDCAALKSTNSSCVLLLLRGTGTVEKKAFWQEKGTGQGAMSEMDLCELCCRETL